MNLKNLLSALDTIGTKQQINESLAECGEMPLGSPIAPKQMDTASISVSMTGAGRNGMRDIIDVLARLDDAQNDQDDVMDVAIEKKPGMDIITAKEDFANSPNEEFGSVDDVISSGDDLHKSKGAYAKAQNGDNAMAVPEEADEYDRMRDEREIHSKDGGFTAANHRGPEYQDFNDVISHTLKGLHERGMYNDLDEMTINGAFSKFMKGDFAGAADDIVSTITDQDGGEPAAAQGIYDDLVSEFESIAPSDFDDDGYDAGGAYDMTKDKKRMMDSVDESVVESIAQRLMSELLEAKAKDEPAEFDAKKKAIWDRINARAEKNDEEDWFADEEKPRVKRMGGKYGSNYDAGDDDYSESAVTEPTGDADKYCEPGFEKDASGKCVPVTSETTDLSALLKRAGL